MRTTIFAYWTATILIALETLVGGIADLVHGKAILVAGTPVADIVTHLGYPLYFLQIIGVWKLLGGIVLLIPGCLRLKEWAYAGFTFTWIAATVAHYLAGDGPVTLLPVTLLGMVAVSYLTRSANRSGSAKVMLT